jgi:CRP-like cAMP-binding protein
MEYDNFDLKLTRSLSPLKSMSTSHLLALLDGTSVDTLCAGDVLFTAGHYDDQHIYLLHGEVTFSWPDGRGAIIRAGETLLPLSSFQPRQVTAVANTDCSVLRIPRERLDKLLTWSAVADHLQLNLSLRRELDDDIDWIMAVLRSNLFFKVSPLHVEDILARLEPQTVLAGEVVIRQGDVGDRCFFIREGEAEVSRYHNGVRTRLADVGPGRCIGEDALVNEALRNASVTMRTDGCLMSLSKKDFLLLLQEPAVESLALSAMREALQGGAVAVDVRSEEEYIQSHIRQAVNVPLDLLGIKARLLNKKTTYITYCDTGRRSRAAAFFLRNQGFNTFALADCATLFGAADWQDILETNNNYLLREGVAVPGQ